jgi:hypothetical protein
VKKNLLGIALQGLALVAAVTAIALMASFPVRADQSNIDAAMKQAVRDNRANGETAMQERAQFCYDSVDYRRGASGSAKGVEYCMSYEFAAVALMSDRGQWNAASGYFNGADVITRAALYLGRARVLNRPEEFDTYWQPRSDYIQKNMRGVQ